MIPEFYYLYCGGYLRSLLIDVALNADNLSVAHCEFFENFLVQQGDPTFIIGWPPMEIAHKPTFENTRIEDGSDWAYALVNWSDESRLTVNGIDERARATRRVDEIYRDFSFQKDNGVAVMLALIRSDERIAHEFQRR
ncbi:hypothetical protein PHYBLDRAFT_70781 [Phycomyces blakesleeanus NRRL 1555(-)]|uniref:Uncharacterized protein n=1 Tax=Phycomyces blakesleeanus (strain ATCC 8743b / DSM 1359 / FGSC 10004 / NBRC 33097 / NRRL 1555) TaxID=763407 RepID=A0A162TW23_PHYB8|nr:hypothetical protein PHYBLDRAFT_70781 [Phycomyces blakesleeanus NRRL 1555(-)]OAD71432.1 hypothetical protein PHYBLDRAFT_70781 [Phycomyces blakesleeanus NRRL 1555(-)]|eukprot:XP_018289472.1 hypothetical protein PHYBLDRAFT_70781 [Phycomyces blakesleeanus NRRL 1555(-)]